MRNNTTPQTDNMNPRFNQLPSTGTPEIQIQRPDGSWKPIGACVAAPEQFERRLSSRAIDQFIDSARRSNVALERAIAAIKQRWNG